MATLDVVFQKPDGAEETKTFTKRPLGMDFLRRMPIVVTQSKAESLDLGVEKGWVIKAVGGESFDAMDFDAAYKHFKQAISPLRQDIVVRETPVDEASVAALNAKVGPLDPAEVPAYLKRFGYEASSAEAWKAGATQSEISLGVIDGHREKGAPYTHTWYALQCRLILQEAGQQVLRWQVERRLAHLRACLHVPIKRELGKEYDKCFEGAHFAHHAGPPGTTLRLEHWLAALAKHINSSKVTPGLTATVLRFLETPDLTEAVPSAAAPAPAPEPAAEPGTEKALEEAPAPDGLAGARELDEKTDDGASDAGEEGAAAGGGAALSPDASPNQMSL